MDQSLARRHGIAPATVRQTGLGSTLLWESFDSAEGSAVSGWDVVGQPIITVKKDSIQGKYLLMSGPQQAGRHGLVRRLSAIEMAGRTLRIQLKLLQTGPGKLTSSSVPRVQFEWQRPGPQTVTALKVPTFPSPGWETCEGQVAVPTGIQDAKLMVLQDAGSPAVGIDDLLVEHLDPLTEARVAGTGGARANLIDGGDFEVGQRNFSVSGDRRVIGRTQLRAIPIAWSIDESVAAVGTRSLRIPLDQDEFRVAFGWVRVQPSKDYVVSLYARSNTRVTLRLGVVEYPGIFRFDYFPVTDQFRRLALTITTRFDLPWSALSVAIRPSDRPNDAYTKDAKNFLWLDAVSLTPGEPKSRYDAPSSVEIGIVGGDSDPTDLSHMVQQGKSLELMIRLINYQSGAYEGQVAVDVLDSFDRPALPQRDYTPRIDAGQVKEQKLTLADLPRGYYKVLATAWPGRIGEGRPHSSCEYAFAVVNLSDPVPTGNYFGVTVENPRMSRRITQLGAGWIWLRAARPWCETPAGELDWTWYGELLKKARDQHLEVAAGLNWDDGQSPLAPGDPWRKVCYQFAQVSKDKVEAIGILDQSGARDLPTPTYLELTGQASAEIRRAVQKVDVVAVAHGIPGSVPFERLEQAMKGELAKSVQSIAIRFPQTDLPEDIEPALEQIRTWRKAYPFKQYLDVAVGNRSPTAYLHIPNLNGYDTDTAGQGPDVSDPVLHATRLIRAFAIRQFAMIDRAAWWVESHRPPDILRPTVDPQCHEYDNAPRPSLVAFDFMTEILNTALLTEWVDLPQQIRALCFDLPEGHMVVLIWRPSGWSLYPIVLKDVAGRVSVCDVFGRQETHPSRGGDLLVMVNEAVRYLLVPASAKSQVLECLRKPVPAAVAVAE